VSYQVNWEVQALDRTAGFLSEDMAGVGGLWESQPDSDPNRPNE
jgi:hypothetical protein